MKLDELLVRLKGYFEKQDDAVIAFLFGSYARGFPKRESDIDIAVLFADEGDEDEIFKRMTDISYEISLFTKKEVNVLTIFRDFRKPMLYYNAIVLGMPIFVRDKLDYTNLVVEAIFQMEDFCLFGQKWQIQVASSLLGR